MPDSILNDGVLLILPTFSNERAVSLSIPE
jgi:hypothetical protein